MCHDENIGLYLNTVPSMTTPTHGLNIQSRHTAPLKRGRPKGLPSASGSSGFSNAVTCDRENIESTHSISMTSPTSHIEGCESVYAITSQSVMNSHEQHSQTEGIRYSHILLDQLEQLQQDLLQSMPTTTHDLQNFHNALNHSPPIQDPKLRSIVEDIQVRAAVEYAKRVT